VLCSQSPGDPMSPCPMAVVGGRCWGSTDQRPCWGHLERIWGQVSWQGGNEGLEAVRGCCGDLWGGESLRALMGESPSMGL